MDGTRTDKPGYLITSHELQHGNITTQNNMQPQLVPTHQTYYQPKTEISSDPDSQMNKHPQESPPMVDREVIQLPSWKWKIITIALMLIMALLGYDASNLADTQVAIFESFGHLERLPWVMASFSLANAASAPLMRRLMAFSDLKWFASASLGISAIGGVVCGSAQDMNSMIVGRLLVGMGISGAYLSVLTLLRLITTPSELARINGLLGAGFAVGLILGPVIGASFTANEHATWRWASYITAPWIVIILVLIPIGFPSIRPERTDNVVQGLLKIDWLGELLHIATLVLFNTACLFSGTSWEWKSGSAITTWVMLGVVTTIYALQQYFCLFTAPDRRIFPIDILRTRVGALTFVSTACCASSWGFLLYYSGLYFAFARGYGAIQSAVHLLPFLFLYIFGALLSGILLPRIKVYASIYLIGGILIAAGGGAMSVVNSQTSTSTFMGIVILLGLGVGLTFQLGIAVLPVAVPPELAHNFSIVMNQAQYIGVTMSLSIAGCIYQNVGFNRLRNDLPGSAYSDNDIRQALAGVDSSILEGTSPETIALVTSTVVDVIVKIFFLCVANGVVMVLAACCMKWEKLNFLTEAEKESSDSA